MRAINDTNRTGGAQLTPNQLKQINDYVAAQNGQSGNLSGLNQNTAGNQAAVPKAAGT